MKYWNQILEPKSYEILEPNSYELKKLNQIVIKFSRSKLLNSWVVLVGHTPARSTITTLTYSNQYANLHMLLLARM